MVLHDIRWAELDARHLAQLGLDDPVAPRGTTPVVDKTGKRLRVNAMCAIGNKGELYFTVYTGSFNTGVFLPFLDRLTRHLDRKVHLIVDGHPVHRRKTVQQWIDKHAEAIEMHFLPGYSPN